MSKKLFGRIIFITWIVMFVYVLISMYGCDTSVGIDYAAIHKQDSIRNAFIQDSIREAHIQDSIRIDAYTHSQYYEDANFRAKFERPIFVQMSFHNDDRIIFKTFAMHQYGIEPLYSFTTDTVFNDSMLNGQTSWHFDTVIFYAKLARDNPNGIVDCLVITFKIETDKYRYWKYPDGSMKHDMIYTTYYFSREKYNQRIKYSTWFPLLTKYM